MVAQLAHKRRGLSNDSLSRRALFAHVTTYTLAFVPAFIWIGSELDPVWAIVSAVLIYVPHLVIDDGRLVAQYLKSVKRVDGLNLSLAASVDQSFHVLSLWLVAMLVGAA